MRDSLLDEIDRRAAELDLEIGDREVSRFLEIQAAAADARSILVVGTGLGSSALSLARGAPRARLLTIERDASRLAEARGFLERGEVAERVEAVEGEARDVLPGLSGPFDLVWLDCDPSDRIRCLDLVLPKLIVGGLVVVGGPLFGFDEEAPVDLDEAEAEAVYAFHGYYSIHPQLLAVIVPLGAGLGLATKRRPLVTEMGGPF